LPHGNFRDLVDLKPVYPAQIGEAEEVVFHAGYKYRFNKVLLLGGHAGDTVPHVVVCGKYRDRFVLM